MASKVMLDANVILDYTLKRNDYKTSKQILALTIEGSIKTFITPSIVHICGYWLMKAYGYERAKKVMLTLLADITSIDISHDTTVAALHSSIKNIEDALQYYTALHHKLDYFISRDKQLSKEATPLLPIYTPDQFLKEVKQ